MVKLINKLKNRKGFTLIELIVVLAVLAIIMAIAVPRFIGVQADAEKKADNNTIELIAKAAELYFVAKDINTDTTISPSDLVTKGYLDSVTFNDETKYGANGSDIDIKFVASTGKVTLTDKTTPATVYYPK